MSDNSLAFVGFIIEKFLGTLLANLKIIFFFHHKWLYFQNLLQFFQSFQIILELNIFFDLLIDQKLKN